MILRNAIKLAYLAPAVTFGLGATYVWSVFGLGAAPANPDSWKLFLTLAPLAREPVNLVAGLPGLDYGMVFVLFTVLALAGPVVMNRRPTTGRSHFVYAHLALLMLIYAMGQSGVFTATTNDEAITALPLLGWLPNLGQYPAAGVVLFCGLLIACAACHITMLKRSFARASINRRIDNQITASLAQFG